MVAWSMSTYDDYLFCTGLLIYSKDVAFVFVPWVIICVRFDHSTLGDYFAPGFWTPWNPRMTLGDSWRSSSYCFSSRFTCSRISEVITRSMSSGLEHAAEPCSLLDNWADGQVQTFLHKYNIIHLLFWSPSIASPYSILLFPPPIFLLESRLERGE
jgi:hypothetical protein